MKMEKDIGITKGAMMSMKAILLRTSGTARPSGIETKVMTLVAGVVHHPIHAVAAPYHQERLHYSSKTAPSRLEAERHSGGEAAGEI